MATGRLPDPNTAPLTAKGDLYTYSTVPARLAVGSNGDTLVADSSASTGLRWNPSLNTNAVINGGMDIWQRGTSFANPNSTSSYTVDRFISLSGSSGYTFSRQSSGLTGIQYCMRAGRDSGSTSANNIWMLYALETADSYRLAGQTVTWSFYARKGANFSQASSLLTARLWWGTGTDQNPASGFTGSTTIIDQNVTLTTSWQRFTFTAAVPSNSTQVGFGTFYLPAGTAGAADYYEITGVQLELGSVATPFKRAGSTLAGELAACQRYYEQTFVTAATESANKVSAYSDANYTQGTRWKVTKRATPTVTLFSSNGGTANRIRQISNNTNYTPGSVADIGVDGFNIITGVGQSNMMDFHYTASAEL